MREANFIQTGWPSGDTANNRFILSFNRLALLDLAQSQQLFNSFSRLGLLDLAQPTTILQFFSCFGGFSIPRAFHFMLDQ